VINCDLLLDILPVSFTTAAVSVKEDNALVFHPHPDVRDRIVVDCPLPPE